MHLSRVPVVPGCGGGAAPAFGTRRSSEDHLVRSPAQSSAVLRNTAWRLRTPLSENESKRSSCLSFCPSSSGAKITPAILRSRLLPGASSEIAAGSPGQCDSGRCRRENILPHRTHRPPPRKTAGGKWGGVVLARRQKMPTTVIPYPVRQCMTRFGVSQCHADV
jgi:hypothetical protein